MSRIKNISTKWDLTPLMKEELTEDYLKKLLNNYRRKNKKFINKWKNNPEYLKSPKVLKEALDDYSKLLEENYGSGSLGYYLYLCYALDQLDPKIKGYLNRVQEFETLLENQMSFFTLNLSKIPKKKQKSFLSSPYLKEYRHYLEELFKLGMHLLSEKEENLLNLLSPVSFGNWVRLTKELISKEKRYVFTTKSKKSLKTFEEILSLISSKDKFVRDSAASVFNQILSDWVDVAEREYNSVLQYRKISDDLRHYSRPDASRHLHTDMDTAVVDALLNAVSKNFKLSKRYYKLKAQLFGVKKLAYHERNVPYGSLTEKISYKRAVNLVYSVFSDLDKDFGNIFKDFATSGKIDVFPKVGKSSGAFCIHHFKNHPTYILLNYTSKIQDVTTLAHEAGHGINNELMKKQNPLNFHSPLSTAEVASTFMEDFVLDFLEKSIDDEQKLALLMIRLNDAVSTIFRQVAAYNFEMEAHLLFRNQGYLSKKDIGRLFKKHMVSYMGPYVKQDPGSENWWVYWSHFRRPFYVYTYASGLLISKYMQGRVKEDPSFIENVKDFLSFGSSKSPKEIFSKMGIDITDANFWHYGINEVKTLLIEAESLAKKLGKI